MASKGAPEDEPSQVGTIDAFWAYVHGRPLLHFVVSEFTAGAAAFSVFAFFVLFSAAAERLMTAIPLANGAPAEFLDLVLAWAAALSGAFTFAAITLCNVARLVIRLIRETWR